LAIRLGWGQVWAAINIAIESLSSPISTLSVRKTCVCRSNVVVRLDDAHSTSGRWVWFLLSGHLISHRNSTRKSLSCCLAARQSGSVNWFGRVLMTKGRLGSAGGGGAFSQYGFSPSIAAVMAASSDL